MAMDEEEIENLLRKNLEVTKENNKILGKIHRYIKWSRALRALYWIIIIGSTLGLYYFIQPFIDNVRDVISDPQSTLSNLLPGIFGGTQ